MGVLRREYAARRRSPYSRGVRIADLSDRARDGLLVAGVACAAVLALIVITPDRTDRHPDALAYLLAIAGALALAAWRRPLVALGASASVAVVGAGIGYPPWGLLVAPLVALFFVGLAGGRGRLLAVGVAGLVAAVAATALFGHKQTLHAPETVAHIALVVLPLVAGEAVRSRRAYVAELVSRAELAERGREEEAQRRVEQERLRIARDLHDVAAHTITSISVQAGVAAHLVDRDPAHAARALRSIAETSREALDELRAVVGVLREGDGNGAPLRPLPAIDAIADLVRDARLGGLDVEFETTGDRPERMPEATEVAVYRIVQEALTNARRHAGPVRAGVRLSYGADGLRVAVDNARGDGPAAERASGVGLLGMRERASAAGGTLWAGETPTGFEVTAELPYRPRP